MDKEEIREAVFEALNAHHAEFRTDRKMHYDQHIFLQGLMETFNKCKDGIIGTLTKVAIITLISLVLLGFIFWGKGHLK